MRTFCPRFSAPGGIEERDPLRVVARQSTLRYVCAKAESASTAGTANRGGSRSGALRRIGVAITCVGELIQLRHKRERRNLDFTAGDVGRGTTNADRGHDASALTRLRFHFASAAHQDALLDRKAIGRPAKVRL